MRSLSWKAGLAGAALALSLSLSAAQSPQPYAGLQARAIKALSDQQIADLKDLGEALQHRHELPVLALRDLDVDDVVVEEVFPVPRRDGLQLRTGGVDQDRRQRADFGGDFDGHGSSYSGGPVGKSSSVGWRR